MNNLKHRSREYAEGYDVGYSDAVDGLDAPRVRTVSEAKKFMDYLQDMDDSPDVGWVFLSKENAQDFLAGYLAGWQEGLKRKTG